MAFVWYLLLPFIKPMKELPPKGEETFSTSRGLQDDALHALKIQSMGVTWHPLAMVDSGDLSNWPICFLKNVGKMGKLMKIEHLTIILPGLTNHPYQHQNSYDLTIPFSVDVG